MMDHLIRRLSKANPLSDLDKDRSTVHCLAHIIHLAAMEVLVHVHAVRRESVKAGDVDVAVDLSEELAESLVGTGEELEGNPEDGVGNGDLETDSTSAALAIWKVSIM
jgi:hypothetical protein